MEKSIASVSFTDTTPPTEMGLMPNADCLISWGFTTQSPASRFASDGRSRATHFRIVPFDPILRERQHQPGRCEAWLRDQYQHPEEHSHTVAEIRQWFTDNDVDYLRSFPSTVLDDESDELFAPAVDDWIVERWIAQVGWMWRLGGEGGLFLSIGSRR